MSWALFRCFFLMISRTTTTTIIFIVVDVSLGAAAAAFSKPRQQKQFFPVSTLSIKVFQQKRIREGNKKKKGFREGNKKEKMTSWSKKAKYIKLWALFFFFFRGTPQRAQNKKKHNQKMLCSSIQRRRRPDGQVTNSFMGMYFGFGCLDWDRYNDNKNSFIHTIGYSFFYHLITFPRERYHCIHRW